MALQGGPPVQRPQVSNSIKSSAPILTQQLMESYQSESYHPQQVNYPNIPRDTTPMHKKALSRDITSMHNGAHCLDATPMHGVIQS